MSRSRIPALAITALAGLAGPAAALAPVAAAQAPRAALTACDGHATVRPGSYVIACGDGNTSLTHLRWRHWGAQTATATATEVVNLCTPDCARGTNARFPARVELTRLSGGHYRTIVVHAGPGRPTGVPATQRYAAPRHHARQQRVRPLCREPISERYRFRV